MTSILRLQSLDVRASTKDVRAFFKRTRIPDGGVYIVGGRLREAFIAFATERDAQLAMCQSGKTLKGSKVTLSKSCMEELGKRLKLLLVKKKNPSSFARPQISPASAPKPTDPRLLSPHPPPLPAPITSNPQPSGGIDSGTAFLLGVCTVLGLQSSNKEASKASAPSVDKICNTSISDETRKPEQTVCLESGYVRLFGLPQTATKRLICRFFRGLEVQEVIVNVKLGLSSGCLVKFASEKEAGRALLFNHQLLESNPIEVRRASKKMWMSALQECEDAFGDPKSHELEKNPPKETITCKPNWAALLKRRRVDHLKHFPPKRHRPGGQSAREYWVLVKNLPKNITKTEIKELLGCPEVERKNVLHLLDQAGNRTDTAFVLFTRVEDYEYAINLTGCQVGNRAIQVSTTTRLMMKDMMVKALARRAKGSKKKAPRSASAWEPRASRRTPELRPAWTGGRILTDSRGIGDPNPDPYLGEASSARSDSTDTFSPPGCFLPALM